MEKGTITLSRKEQGRIKVLTLVLTGEITAGEAAVRLKLSLRQVRRLLVGFRVDGAAALAHGNRGRKPAITIPESVKQRILELASSAGYAACNDTHLAELLAEREGIQVSRATLQRWLRASGRPSPRKRRPPRFRKSRQRAPHLGLLLQIDTSFHHWLGPKLQKFALVGAIDDATGRVVSAHFRPQEDTEGYFWMLADILRNFGVPGALYHDGRTTFVYMQPPRATVEEELKGVAPQTQFARAAEQLGIGLIHARSPQAKGRIERLWNTLQDRLVAELGLEGIRTMAEANRFLPGFLTRFNDRFGEAPQHPESGFAPLPPGLVVEAVCCRHHIRKVTGDNTVSVGTVRLQLPPGPRGRSYKGHRVLVQERLDGTWAIFHEEQCLAHPALLAPPKPAPPPPEPPKPRPSVSNKPRPTNPWVIANQKSWERRQAMLTQSPK